MRKSSIHFEESQHHHVTLRKSKRRQFARSKKQKQSSVLSLPSQSALKKENSPRKTKKVQISIDSSSIAETSVVDKQSICVETLTNGFVQSFVDFFYLTHRPSVSPEEEEVSSQIKIETPCVENKHLRLLQSKLMNAETAKRRAGQVDVVYENYESLATHFQEQGDHKTAIYFFEKCLEVANMAVDTDGETRANCSLGLAQEKKGDFRAAVGYFERHAELASDDSQRSEADRNLIRAYVKYADMLEKKKDFEESTRIHEKRLSCAERLDENVFLGDAHYRLGRALVKSGRPQEAIDHIDAYMAVLETTRDVDGERVAYEALAEAYEALDNTDAALSSLQQMLSCAKRSEHLESQAEACFRLGKIYQKRGLYDRAAEFLSQNYELVRTLVSKHEVPVSLLNRARVTLGIAKGSVKLHGYIKASKSNVGSFLKWKNSRTEF